MSSTHCPYCLNWIPRCCCHMAQQPATNNNGVNARVWALELERDSLTAWVKKLEAEVADWKARAENERASGLMTASELERYRQAIDQLRALLNHRG